MTLLSSLIFFGGSGLIAFGLKKRESTNIGHVTIKKGTNGYDITDIYGTTTRNIDFQGPTGSHEKCFIMGDKYSWKPFYKRRPRLVCIGLVTMYCSYLSTMDLSGTPGRSDRIMTRDKKIKDEISATKRKRELYKRSS